MQKIAFFSLIASTCSFYRYFDTHRAGSWAGWTNTLTEFKREGEAELRQSTAPRARCRSPSKEQCCQTLLDPRLSRCPEPNERSWCILRLPDKQSSESLGIIIFLWFSWSFAGCQQLDSPDLSLLLVGFQSKLVPGYLICCCCGFLSLISALTPCFLSLWYFPQLLLQKL